MLRFDCAPAAPGQCVVFDGKYFVIAHSFNGTGVVVTRPKSAIDLPPGTHVDLSKPVGKGFDLEVTGTPVIVTGGLGFAAGLPLVRHFQEAKVDFRMVAYTRHPMQVTDVMGLLSIRESGVKVWNTAVSGRPVTPLDPIDVPITVDTPFFFAGPKELHEACRAELDKRGLTDVRIRLNY